ncbi:MAG TPA: DUF4159 domain-containing protein, partial [Alphaproteobacteria bacterium]|nr:DUF4159 domain-containing protein [Alphaproteobacteria bacterium]
AAGALQPQPWATDRAAAAKALQGLSLPGRPEIFWLSDGIDDGAGADLADRLDSAGRLTVVADRSGPALALLPPNRRGGDLRIPVLRSDARHPQQVTVRVSAARDRLLDRATADFAIGQLRSEATLRLPPEVRNEAERIDLEGASSAAGVVLLDERWKRRSVGLASGGGPAREGQPLLSELYYLKRALDPLATVRSGEVSELLKRPLSLLVLADLGRLAPNDERAVKHWVEQGGMLVRFAGPHLIDSVDKLVPVALRRGGRALGGTLSWSKPAHLAAFPEEGPFRGLPVPDDVVVKKQILAQPSLELDQRTWARLSDGTPLVTGAPRGNGHIVLFHTTANADWSNLALSGLFPAMLQRLLTLSQGVTRVEGRQTMPPLSTLDGFGVLGPAGAAAEPVRASRIGETAAGPHTPPGYYGTAESRRALNLTQGWERLAPLTLPDGITRAGFAVERETDLKPWLLTAALALALIDMLATLALRGFLHLPGRRRTVMGLAALALSGGLLAASGPARAQGPVGGEAAGGRDAFAIAATSETRLAFVRTGDDDIDQMSQAGLEGLSQVLNQRTAVEPGTPMEVDVERDELVFFPLLYWAVSPRQPQLSDTAVGRISRYLRSGGTILFDTRDAGQRPPGTPTSLLPESDAGTWLRHLLQRLDVPPLVPVPENHVLTKAFYLMQSFPGRYAGSELWVEQRESNDNDGVSALVIGGNDWAAAWAADPGGRPLAPVLPGGEQQREMAYRFGVNLVMYTLTGNYKSDQVHVPAILERLGQ